MDLRAEKIAKARQKLKNHQEKKNLAFQKEDCKNDASGDNQTQKNNLSNVDSTLTHGQQYENSGKEFSNERNCDNDEGNINDINVTEILISTKTNLEMQIMNLSQRLRHFENSYILESDNHNVSKEKIVSLEQELSDLSKKYLKAQEDLSVRDSSLNNLKNLIRNANDENNNLIEQLELTKSMLTMKEAENIQLNNKVYSNQQQLDSLQLQIQQLTNNTSIQAERNLKSSDETESLIRKVSNLEQRIEALQKEKDQINTHYEHYMKDLNSKLKSELAKNEKLSKDIQELYNRENSLIEQISDMEIRLQNYDPKKIDEDQSHDISTTLQKDYQSIQEELAESKAKYRSLQDQYRHSLAKIEELNQGKQSECDNENFSIEKLNADITSNKIAAQRATEQNKKLKSDVENLEQVIIKMGKDKLDLTEMWTHEKQLNKGLSLKLAEVEENLKNISKQLKAKDDEMIRLQNENRQLEKKYGNIFEQIHDQINEKHDAGDNHSHNAHNTCHHHHNDNNSIIISQSSPMDIKLSTAQLEINDDNVIPKDDAMNKLQERFLNIMDQVANLSDEKHRLEHIILQLQNETDTICEYVALYQQQRSLLKKREEERSNQLKIYQVECNKLKCDLEELRQLLLRLASDPELETLLKQEGRFSELTRVKELLEKLQNCSLVNPNFKNLDLNIFYPCSCCSGQIIDI